ncbi:MAG: YCF48-related protein [Pyrinomonadaceae bacterium]
MEFLRKFFFIGFILLAGAPVAFAQEGWSVVKTGEPDDFITVFFTDSKRGFVAGDNGHFIYTVDGGKNWQKQFIYTEANINEIYFRNDDDGYVVAGKKLFVTEDGGRSWKEENIYDQSDFTRGTPEFLSVRFADKNRGIIVGSVLNDDERVIDSLVMRTDDGGKSWSRIIVPFKDELYHLDFVNSSRGWIVGDMGTVLATVDGGMNWQLQKTGTDKALYNVDFRDSNDGFAVGGKGTILRTENGGETWELVKTSFPETFLRVDFASDKEGWIVGHKGTILRTSDKGKTWIKQESKTDKSLYGLYMTKKYGWAVGARGTILKYEK